MGLDQYAGWLIAKPKNEKVIESYLGRGKEQEKEDN